LDETIPEQVRPVVETGYENLLLVRLLLEIKLPHLRQSSVHINFILLESTFAFQLQGYGTEDSVNELH
jgi:hypothetical protein